MKIKNKPLILYGRFKVICKKNDDDWDGLLNTVKRFSDDAEMQFSLEKFAKVTFKKGLQVKSKNTPFDINMEITDLEPMNI